MADLVNLTDEQVVEWVRGREKEDYRVLVERYQDKLLRYAQYLVRDPNRAADVVQEAFIKAFVNLRGFDTQKKFSSWMYRIAHNEAMNMIAKHRRETPLVPELNVAGNGDELAEELDRAELQSQVREKLGRLPLLYSVPLALVYLEEKSYEEVSDILRMPVGTVGTRINRGKLMLRKLWQK